jgi:hypothetical protein
MLSHPVVLAIVSLCVGVAIGVLARRRRVSRHGTAALVSLEQLAASLAGLECDLAEQRAETERTRAQRDEQARKAGEYFAKIDGCVTEATECKRLLVRTGAEHGNAQAMMLVEIESLARQYQALAAQYHQATGKPPPRPEPRMNPTIQIIADEFREVHVIPYQAPPAPTPVA